MTQTQSALDAFPTLRQSLLAGFDACALTTRFDLDTSYLPEDFLLDPEGRRVDWNTHPQGRGQLTHRTLAKCLETMRAADEHRITTDVAHAILIEVLRQADVPDHEVVSVPMSQVADLYWIVTKWAHETTWEIEKLVAVEERLHAALTYPDQEGGFVGRILTGQLDALLVEGENLEHAIVLDWKDTWAMPAASEISESGFFQQRFYAWLIFKNHPTVQRVTLREFYVRYSEAREATIDRYMVDAIESELSALAQRFDRAYETDVWKPSPGKHCSYCVRPTACPIFPKARGNGEIASQQEAERIAAQLVVAEAAAKQAKDKLKAWADAHGDVPIRDAKNNRVYGYQKTRRVDRPTRDALERALLEARSRVSGKLLDQLYREKSSTRFAAHVPRPPEIEPDDEIMDKLAMSLAEARERMR